MANFQTHLNAGILVSAAATLGLFAAGTIPGQQTLPLFALGVAGSLLPDIDADASKPVSLLFGVFGAGLAFAMTLPLVGALLPLELALVWAGVYLCVRYGFFHIFTRLTVHRGIWHSWLAAAAATLATVDLAYWLWHQPADLAWVAGGLVGLGYLTHLTLDELYSVDLLNIQVKRSFGTALKPFSLADPLSSVAMLSLVLLLAWLAPASDVWTLVGALEVPRSLGELQAWLGALLDTLAARLDYWTQWLHQYLRSV